jgi:phosphoribosylamine--glycine ligase
MKVLIVGGGGREHALAWKTAQSPRVEQVFVAPGNAGTAREPKVQNLNIAAVDSAALVALARDQGVDLTLVGPEAPLVAGIVDAFAHAGLRCFGPTRAAAQLEGSKAFAKAFLKRHGIPTAVYQSFTDVDEAVNYIRQVGAPIVVKADGLAAGKGVTVAETEAQAIEAAHQMLVGNAYGEAGRRVIIEEFLRGEEASFIALVDGKHVIPLATSQDHKARDDGDRGPNTGGMGAYSPALVITPSLHQRILDEIILPTVRGMAQEGHCYTGFLYAGLMIGLDGTPRVLEYNCRFGDPEAEPIVLRLRSDLIDLCEAALEGQLDTVEASWDPCASLGVVMAQAGYPGHYNKGEVIHGIAERDPPDTKVFHAGTRDRDGTLVTAGGRVLCVCALGTTISEAQARAYGRVARIHWNGVYYRKDIGHRAVLRER